MRSVDKLQEGAINLLKMLIATPSFSGEESETAGIIASYFEEKGLIFKRLGNNIVSKNQNFSDSKPTLLLNSHHDTVKVVNGWTKDPFGAEELEDKIYGLGSNDAGASLVSLIACFTYYYDKELDFNIILAATAEEENFGPYGVKSLLNNELSSIDLGIVGEPTEMNIAVAEKGLLVIDGEVLGKAGHAARSEGENAIYKAIQDITAIQNFHFDKVSEVLGPNVINVTQIDAGYQHNVVPDICKYVIDLRVNDCYSLHEAFEIVDKNTVGQLKARSFNNNPSGINSDHPLVIKGIAQGMKTFGSATLSDQAHMKFPTIKLGVGKSERSHTPDEFICIEEINEGIVKYIELLNGLKF